MNKTISYFQDKKLVTNYKKHPAKHQRVELLLEYLGVESNEVVSVDVVPSKEEHKGEPDVAATESIAAHE